MKDSFNKGLSEAINGIAFIPDISDEQLLKIDSCLVDTLGYSKYFPQEHITVQFPNNLNVVNHNLLFSNKLVSLGAQDFTYDDLEKFFNSDKFRNDAENDKKYVCKIISFLCHLEESDGNLKKQKFILDNLGKLQAPENLYFPSDSISGGISFAELPLIDAEVYNNIKISPDIIKWLADLDVKYPKDIEVLRKSIFKLILEDKISTSNNIEVVRFIFKQYKKGDLTDNDYNTLKKIKLLTNNGLEIAEKVYLADAYKPILPLERMIPEQSYVSVNYVENNADLEYWKNLFLKLNVKEKITAIKYTDRIERGELSRIVQESKDYLTWIDLNNYYDTIYAPYKYTGQHSVSNFKYFYFLNHLKFVDFAKLFWNLIFENWNNYIDSSETMYHYRGGGVKIPDYLYFYIRSFQSIPAVDGNCYKSTEIYAPKFKNILKTRYSVADFKINSLNKDQINYLGLKQLLEIDTCIDLLKDISDEEVDNDTKKQIFAIYDEILKSYKDGNRISEDLSTVKLLALNNTYQLTNNLYYFNVDSLSPSVNSELFIQLPDDFDVEEKKLFCSIFEISIITYNDLEFYNEGIQNDSSLKEKLSEVIFYLSVIISHKESVDFNRICSNLSLQLKNATIYKAKQLNLVYRKENGEVVYEAAIPTWHDNDRIYFSGIWGNPLILYSLSSLLCAYFNINNIDKELVLFLQISEDEIKNWLTEKGYDIRNYYRISDLDSNMSENKNETIQNEIIPEISIDSISIEEFTPEIKAGDADISTVKISMAEPISLNYSSISRQYNRLEDNDVKIDIGRWSEEYVFNYLKSRNIYSTVEWMNQEKEAFLPYDFIVRDNQSEQFIEVKGTPSNSKSEFYMSKNEWTFMFAKRESYSIYRLLNAGKKEGVEIKLIKDPYIQVSNGNMMSDTILVYI